MHAMQMISTHPDVRGNPNDELIRCIEECYDCAQICISCADACLAEQMVAELRQCIRLNLDCADVCAATGRLASRRTGSNEHLLRAMLEACAEACRLCGTECAAHAAKHEHCAICAESCRRCEQACIAAAGTVTRLVANKSSSSARSKAPAARRGSSPCPGTSHGIEAGFSLTRGCSRTLDSGLGSMV